MRGYQDIFQIVETIEWQATEQSEGASKATEQSEGASKATEQSEGASCALETKVWYLIDGTTSRCVR